MNRLHMISLAVNLRELRRLSAVHGLGADEGLALHHFLSETFGKGAIQPFRLMPGRNSAVTASLYGYADTGEAELRESAEATGLPEYARLFDIGHLAAKPIPESWPKGKRLGFDIRIRPIRRLLKPLAAETRETRRAAKKGQTPPPLSKGAEVDAYLVDTLRRNPMNDPAITAGPTREAIYRGWLAERLRGAALDADATRMTAYERTRAIRNGKVLEAPDVVFHGELTITDTDAFQKNLARGVGRHTAYGYGMLLLRPARR